METTQYKKLKNEEIYDGSFSQAPDYECRPIQKEMDIKKFKMKVWKNVFIEAFSFLMLFLGFHPVANLQSSINKKLGIAGLWVIYVNALLSCIFLPSYFIKRLGTKWTISLSMLFYSAYIAAQFYPTYYTIIPTASLVGIGAGPLWAGNNVYLTKIGKLYNSRVNPEKPEATLQFFFGVFFLFFQSASVLGNTISSTVLSAGESNATKLLKTDYKHCGAAYCPLDQPLSAETPAMSGSDESTQKFEFMFSIFVVCSLSAAVLNALFLDPIETLSNKKVDLEKPKSSCELIVATFTQIRTNRLQQLLIPLTICGGLKHAFFSSNFPMAYITCEHGVQEIGYVMILYGVNNALFSICSSFITQKLGRITVMTGGTVLFVSLLIALLLWKPDPGSTSKLLVFTSVWGISDAIMQTQLNALYGIIFPENSEAAFSNLALWQNLGFIVIYTMGDYCIVQIIHFILMVILIGASLYYVVESLHRKNIRSQILQPLQDKQDKEILITGSPSIMEPARILFNAD